MKHLSKLLFTALLVFSSCSQQSDEIWEQHPGEPPKNLVGLMLDKATLDAFSEQNITEVGIYVYQNDSLVFGENLPLADGNLSIALPLGEKLQTFVIANAARMTDTDSLSKVTVYQDATMQKQIYISDIVDFTSDNSVSNLQVELKRLVGQAVFLPTENEVQLNAVTQFDRLNLTFTNVGVGYKIQSGECIQEDRTIQTDKTTGFSGYVYSLPTLSGSSRTAIDVVYLLDNREVTRTHSPLDTGIAFEPSKRTIVEMPVLEEAYLTNGWTRAGNSGAPLQLFTMEESEF